MEKVKVLVENRVLLQIKAHRESDEPLFFDAARLDVGNTGLGKDVLVVIFVFELSGSIFVADDNAVIVILERRAGAHCGNGAFDKTDDGVLFSLTEGKENDFLRIHNRANPHRHRLRGNVFDIAAKEEACIIIDCLLGEHLRVCPAREGTAGLIEGNVSIGANAEKLNVNATGGFNGGFIFGA